MSLGPVLLRCFLFLAAGIGWMSAASADAAPVEDARPAWIDPRVLSYEGPACAHAWSARDFDAYLAGRSWWPKSTDKPFAGRGLAQGSRSDEKAFRDLFPTYSADKDGNHILEVHPGLDGYPVSGRPPPQSVLWVDIDGDGMCDAIVLQYVDTGSKADTFAFIFLQTQGGFRLVDFTPDNDTRNGGGFTPDPLLPVWIKGDPRPFLAARQTVDLVAAGSLFDRDGATGFGENRVAIRWDPARQDWTIFYSGDWSSRGVRTVGDVVAEFIRKNPPKATGPYCREGDLDWKCFEPR